MISFNGILTNLQMDKTPRANSTSSNKHLQNKKKLITNDKFIKSNKKPLPEKNQLVKFSVDSLVKEKPAQNLSQNMTDYPINQFYILLTENNFWEGNKILRDKEGKPIFDKTYNINDDKEAFYNWFSETVSTGTDKGSPLPKIEIDGPTGVRTIRETFENPENVKDLLPLYIIACDWHYNNFCLNDSYMIDGLLKLARNHIKQDFGIKLDKNINIENFNYSKYLEKKEEYLKSVDKDYLNKKKIYVEKLKESLEQHKESKEYQDRFEFISSLLKLLNKE